MANHEIRKVFRKFFSQEKIFEKLSDPVSLIMDSIFFIFAILGIFVCGIIPLFIISLAFYISLFSSGKLALTDLRINSWTLIAKNICRNPTVSV